MRPVILPLLASVLVSQPSAFGADSGNRPNVLFIFSDDHASHAIGAYRGWLAGVDPTPAIDRLAAQGMLFERSYCTNSICGPSRAVILTGKHSHLNGFRTNKDRFDASQTTFPKLLRGAGYQTAIIGKWHLKTDPTGFDHWCVLPGQGAYYNPRFRTAEGVIHERGYCTDLVTDKAEAWLREGRDPDKPFFLMCQHKAPHRNWMPGPNELGLYAEQTIPEPATLFDDWSDNSSHAAKQQMTIEKHLDLQDDLFAARPDGAAGLSLDLSGQRNLKQMTPRQREAWDAAFAHENQSFVDNPPTGSDLVRWKYQRYIKNYLRCVRGVDRSVGRLMALLDELGLDRDTVVIYSSDQGFYLGDHGWYDKRWMYDESLAMPLIVKWPGVTTGGARREELIQNLDYAPTFLAMAGVEPPTGMQGESLVPLLRGEGPGDWRRSIYYHYYAGPPAWHHVAPHRGVRTETHKLIHFYETDEWELYDLRDDPDELDNIYGAPAQRAETRRLREELDRLREAYLDI